MFVLFLLQEELQELLHQLDDKIETKSAKKAQGKHGTGGKQENQDRNWQVRVQQNKEHTFLHLNILNYCLAIHLPSLVLCKFPLNFFWTGALVRVIRVSSLRIDYIRESICTKVFNSTYSLSLFSIKATLNSFDQNLKGKCLEINIQQYKFQLFLSPHLSCLSNLKLKWLHTKLQKLFVRDAWWYTLEARIQRCCYFLELYTESLHLEVAQAAQVQI